MCRVETLNLARARSAAAAARSGTSPIHISPFLEPATYVHDKNSAGKVEDKEEGEKTKSFYMQRETERAEYRQGEARQRGRGVQAGPERVEERTDTENR